MSNAVRVKHRRPKTRSYFCASPNGNVVRTIKKMAYAYGFHHRTYFRLKILRQCGKLGVASAEKD